MSKHHTLITNSKTNSNRLKNTAVRSLLASMHVMRGLPFTIQPWLNPNYSLICFLSYRIPRIIARGDYFFFRTLFSHHITLTLDRDGIKRKYLMSTCILFLLPFSRAFSKVWILLPKKPNSHWSRVNAWVNFWQLNNNFLWKSESYWPPIWIDQATPVGNNTENTITMNFRTQIDHQFC